MVIIAIGCFFLWRRRRNQSRPVIKEAPTRKSTEKPRSPGVPPYGHGYVMELDGRAVEGGYARPMGGAVELGGR